MCVAGGGFTLCQDLGFPGTFHCSSSVLWPPLGSMIHLCHVPLENTHPSPCPSLLPGKNPTRLKTNGCLSCNVGQQSMLGEHNPSDESHFQCTISNLQWASVPSCNHPGLMCHCSHHTSSFSPRIFKTSPHAFDPPATSLRKRCN